MYLFHAYEAALSQALLITRFQPGKVLKIMGIIFGVIALALGLWGLWGAGANALGFLP